MNKLKVLLIAGLLSLTSVSFASTYTEYAAYGNETGDDLVGKIGLANGEAVTFDGSLATITDDNVRNASTSVFWDLEILGGSELYTFGWANNVIDQYNNSDLVTTFYKEVAGVWTSFATFTNSTFGLSLAAGNYQFQLSGLETTGYSGSISAVPVPAAGILFASALLGAGAFGRRKKKSAKSSMVGAFTRAS